MKHPNEVNYYSQNNFDPYNTYDIGRSHATAGWVSTPTDIARIVSSIGSNPTGPNSWEVN